MSTSEPVAGSAGTVTIHHDYESGTTAQGTEKDSPARHAITANRSWTWSRYARAWLLFRLNLADVADSATDGSS
jgi:hypothetical protein